LTGASLLLRRQSLEEVGVLDEGFFMYWEDADLCFRLRNAGWRLAVACNSHVWHKKFASSGKNKTQFDWLLWKSTVRFCEIHAPFAFIPTVVVTLRMLAKRVFQLEWMRAAELGRRIAVHSRDGSDGSRESEGSAAASINQHGVLGVKKR
jgi:GT2 family glycosyltransferase